jgi:DNA-binding response OmpR family regulator
MAKAINVLLVEDDIDIRESLTRLFRKFGFGVTACKDFSEAKNALDAQQKDRPVDIVVTDYNYPGTDGYDRGGAELVRYVHEEYAGMPILLMTGAVRSWQKENPDFSEIPVIAKPFRVATLIAKINEALKAKGKPSIDVGVFERKPGPAHVPGHG